MPRLTVAVPKYRKHKNSGQAVVTLYGRDNYLGPFGSKPSKELYRRLIAEYLAANRQAPVEVDEITIIELIADYWRHCKGYYVKNGQPTTEQNSIRIALRELKELYGTLPASEFTPRCLKALRHNWITKGHARSTINQNVGRVVRMFRWAVAEEKIHPAIKQALEELPWLQPGRTEARETARILPVSIETVNATLPHLSPIVAIWSDCNYLPELDPLRFANSRRAALIAARTFGNSMLRVTRPSITSESALSTWGQSRKRS